MLKENKALSVTPFAVIKKFVRKVPLVGGTRAKFRGWLNENASFIDFLLTCDCSCVPCAYVIYNYHYSGN